MNDFTKDELQIIFLEMNIVIRRTNKEGILKISPIYFELRDKIGKMIDDYCEHDWENICCQCSLDKICCHKCERTFNENK